MIQFFYGEDSYGIAEAVKQIKSSAKQADIVEIEIAKDIADKGLCQSFRQAFENQGLFAKSKILILNNLLAGINKFPLSEEYLLDLIERPPQDEVFFVQTENFDKRLKFYKKLQKIAESREFVMPSGKDLANWIKNRFAEAKCKIGESAVNAFISFFQEECTLWQIDQEINKLVLYCWGRQEIKSADVEAVVSRNVSQDVFGLVNLVAEQGNVNKAISYLEQMLGASQAAELKNQIIQIVGVLASQFRSLILVKDLEKLSPGEIAEKLSWKEGRVWVMQKLSKKFTVSRLRKLLSDLKALDMRLKTSEEPPKLLLSLYFQKVAAK